MEVIVTGGTLSNEEQKYYESHVLEKYPHLEISRTGCHSFTLLFRTARSFSSSVGASAACTQ